MVNLVLDRELYEEFIQGRVRAAELAPAVERILEGGSRRQLVEQGMADVVAALGGDTNASRNAAAEIAEMLSRDRSRNHVTPAAAGQRDSGG